MKTSSTIKWIISAGLFLQGIEGVAQWKGPEAKDAYGENSNLDYFKRYEKNAKKKSPKTPFQAYTEIRLMMARGRAKAANIFNLEFNGSLPLTEKEMSHYDEWGRIVAVNWKSMTDAIGEYDKTYPPPNGIIRIIPELSGLRGVLQRELLRTEGHEMIHMLETMTAVLIPDSMVPQSNDILQRVYGMEMNRVLSMDESPAQRAERIVHARDFKRDADGKLPNSYLLSRQHILTTFHALMVGSRLKSDRIPKSLIEFYQVLDLAGIKLPEAIKTQLQATSGGKAARQRFHGLIPAYQLDVAEFVERVNSLSDSQREQFCKTVVPVEAGIVLNLYGHINGLKAMDVNAPDPEGARKFVDWLSRDWVHQAVKSSLALTEAQWRGLAEKVGPAYAGQVFMQAILQPGSDTKAVVAIRSMYPIEIERYVQRLQQPVDAETTIPDKLVDEFSLLFPAPFPNVLLWIAPPRKTAGVQQNRTPKNSALSQNLNHDPMIVR
jgi:hypothetical protein